MESGWVKYFIDNTVEQGCDKLVSRGLKSWSKGRLAGMSAVEVVGSDKSMKISAPAGGTFWQSDDYEVAGPGGANHLVRRRISKQLDFSDKAYEVVDDGRQVEMRLFNGRAESHWHTRSMKPVVTLCEFEDDDVVYAGKWLVLEMDVDSGQVSSRISDSKV